MAVINSNKFLNKGRWIIFVATVTVFNEVTTVLSDDEGNHTDYAELQLVNFRDRTPDPIGVLSISNGAPVEYHDATSTINDDLIRNELFMETFAQFVRERIPERVVHAKGAGAFGYFEVTHNLSHICKAKFLDGIGKRTPVAVRFSLSNSGRGSADTASDARGFAIKFYTEEGNFDLVGFHTPMFFDKDPMLFASGTHALRKNPASDVPTLNAIWDFRSLRPETLHINIVVSSNRGTPDGYRYMPGFSVHTYEVKNRYDTSYFVRFHILPDAGLRNLNSSEAIRLAGVDPNYSTRDLYNAIARGDFPSWTIYVQILTLDDIRKSKHDHFDLSRVIPLDEYPLHQIGKLVLDRNPLNAHAEIEQLAFCPGNLVPGILGAPDKIFEARMLVYKDALRYRLGSNFNKIKVNCPLNTPVWTYNRDGVAPVADNEIDSPNFFPNSFHGAKPYLAKKAPRPMKIFQTDAADNFDQAGDLYRNEFSQEERESMIVTIVRGLSVVVADVQQRAIREFKKIDADLGNRIVEGLRSIAVNGTN